jgi:hypothetical protein
MMTDAQIRCMSYTHASIDNHAPQGLSLPSFRDQHYWKTMRHLVFDIYVKEYAVHRVIRSSAFTKRHLWLLRTLFWQQCISKLSKFFNIVMSYKVDFIINLFNLWYMVAEGHQSVDTVDRQVVVVLDSVGWHAESHCHRGAPPRRCGLDGLPDVTHLVGSDTDDARSFCAPPPILDHQRLLPSCTYPVRRDHNTDTGVGSRSSIKFILYIHYNTCCSL